MTDDRTSFRLRPRHERALTHLTRVGGTFAASGDDGVPRQLRTKVAQREVVVASTLAEGVERGSRLSARAHDGHHALTLVFVVEELQPTTGGRVDVLLRLCEIVDRGDERRDGRVAVDATGTAAAVDPYGHEPVGRPLPMTLVEASRSGLAFILSRRLEAGEAVDVTFDDGTGVTVRCRVAVVRVERVVYGRHRYAAQITTIDELDRRRLERMVDRARDGGRVSDDEPIPAAVAGDRRSGSLRRLLARG